MDEYISRKAAMFALTNEANTHSNPVKRAYSRATAIIEQITAEDVQPVKHGKWRKAEQGYDTYVECSECGLNLEMSNYVESEWRELLKYCPCCGARMDLKEGDEE